MVQLLIPRHALASWLLKVIDNFLTTIGLTRSGTAEQIVYTIVVIGVALLLGWIIRKIVVLILQKIVYRRRTMLIEDLQREEIIRKSTHIIPPLVFLALIPFAFETDPKTLSYIVRFVLIYFLIVLGWTICAVFNIVWSYYDRRENIKKLPLRGVLNITKGIVWIIIAIIIISIILDKSPGTLLAGLGAFAAALMLIFKDSILGFVAGLQLSFNDMVRVGDWIAVPGTIANGIVVDVSLTTVKIRNWNNTTLTIPPYTLVSTPLQNWNKMKERGRRQIESSLLIDVSTVAPSTPELLDRLKKIDIMQDYITVNQQWAAEGKATSLMQGDVHVNGSIDTNLGLFRAYVGLYLRRHPYVSVDSGATCMVRLLEHTPNGIPLQVFCYVNTVDWVTFEGIQSDIFEHLMAIAPTFGLSAFSSPTGRDVVNIANANPQGLPYNGTAPVNMPAYDPKTNFVIPPNTSGDPGYTFSTVAVYPKDLEPVP
ncbi:MAG: mechanosensitive ion channel family protein [Muribaculum sp.]|nr:mechanosensitive ion channel family protein [Muribaculum sp.]